MAMFCSHVKSTLEISPTKMEIQPAKIMISLSLFNEFGSFLNTPILFGLIIRFWWILDACPYPRCQLIVKAIIRGPYGPISKHVIMLMDLWWHMVTIYQNSSGFTHSMPWLHQVGSRPHFHASLHTTSKHSLIYAWLSHHACLSHTLTVPNMRKIMLTNKHL